MNNSLLTESLKSKISDAIYDDDYKTVISILDSIKTPHAGTAKTKDKRYVLLCIEDHIFYLNEVNPDNAVKDFYSDGREILSIHSDNAKEIGINIIARSYSYKKESVTNWLYKISNDLNWEVREYAAGAVTNVLIDNPDFYKTLKKWSADKSENIRRVAVMAALGLRDKQNYKKAFVLLEPLMYDKSIYVKKNLGPFILGSYFGNRLPDETFRQFDKWIKIKDEHVRWNIAMSFNCSFGNKYPDKALKYLEILSRDKSKVVSRAVLSTLRSLNKRHPRLIGKFIKKNNIKL